MKLNVHFCVRYIKYLFMDIGLMQTQPHSRVYTPAQVRLIVEALGEP